MRTQIIILAVLAIITSGCSSWFTDPKLGKEEAKKCRIDTMINQETRRFVTGTKEVLEAKREKGTLTKEEQVSLDLTMQAERLLGGEPIEKMDISELLTLNDSNNASDTKKYKQLIREKKDKVTNLLNAQLNNETEITALEKQRELAGGFWEFLKRIAIWILFGLVALVVLSIISPSKILGGIMLRCPTWITHMGLGSAHVIEALVKGIQKARSNIADLPDELKVDKQMILDKIEEGLKEKLKNNPAIKYTIDVLKDEYGLESVTDKLKKSKTTK